MTQVQTKRAQVSKESLLEPKANQPGEKGIPDAQWALKAETRT